MCSVINISEVCDMIINYVPKISPSLQSPSTFYYVTNRLVHQKVDLETILKCVQQNFSFLNKLKCMKCEF